MPSLQSPRASRSGQSIIEAVIAISILTVGFLGIAALLSQSLYLERVVADQTTATYLAAEGIELMKNLSDHDVYMRLAGLGPGWGNCLPHPGWNEIELDYSSLDCSRSFDSGDFLKFDPATGLYGYNLLAADNPVATNFTRDIRVFWAPGQPNMDVQSIVSWSTGPFTSQTVVLEDYFYNWHP